MASVHNLIVKRGEAEILKDFSAEFPVHLRSSTLQ